MFKKKGKDASQNAGANVDNNKYEFIAKVQYSNETSFTKTIELHLKYRLLNSNSSYKSKRFVIVSEFTDTEEQFVKRGNEFMDNFKDRVIEYAKRIILSNRKEIQSKEDKKYLLKRIASMNEYEFVIEVD
ncbi:hypothetical protein [Paenibacillus sp. Mc5Re-14]|uniref:hypothetical protein n=1 Tax=Paenibacillus sp. Mc5Re-14 TaxID=1030529 RepID=UPI000AE2988D|nr:hypothetical protein [Paenibacillus sp. Mc5Re-14]